MEAIRLLKRRPWGIAGVGIILVVVLVAALAPLIAPFSWNEININARLQPPGGSYLLGTDNVGRDIFSRLVYATRTYVGTGLVAAITAAILGFILGIIANITGRRIDNIFRISVFVISAITGLTILVMLFFAILRFLPFPLHFLTVMITFGRNINVEGSWVYIDLVLSLLFLSSNYYVTRKALVSRSKLNSLWQGLGMLLIVNLGVATGMAALILFQSGLLGLGVPPPFPEWGSMLSGAGRQFLFSSPWMWRAPVTTIWVTIVGLALFSISVREVWIPRLARPQGTD